MTDKDKMLEMLSRNNINHTVEESGSISTEDGYLGFYTIFEFTFEGNLKSVKAFE